MEKKQYICPKCGNTQYESDQFQATGGNFSKIFDIQNKKFITDPLMLNKLLQLSANFMIQAQI